MKIVLLGAPGSGKGTQASQISEHLGMKSLSTGSLLREAAKLPTEMGMKIDALLKAGELAPDEIVVNLVEDFLAKEENVIFDGFPRNVRQAELLDQITKVSAVIYLDVPDDLIADRMAGRRICSHCGASYHLKANPPKTEGICDHCGTQLTVRSDDAPEVVAHRLEVYHKTTQPLIEYYRSKGLLISIDGHGEVADITKRIFAALDAMQ